MQVETPLEKSLWEKYKADFAERSRNKRHVVRPSPLGLEYYYDVYVGQQAKNYGDCGILGKSNFMNGTVRVPMVVRTPETVGSSVAGKTCASHAEWFDAGPSLVELAGGEIEHRQFAKSLCPMLSDPSVEHRSEAISEYGGDVMLLNHEWKIALNQEGKAYMLFDVKNDPDEINNLAGKAAMAQVTGEKASLFEPPGSTLLQNVFPSEGKWSWRGAHFDGAVKARQHKTFPGPFFIGIFLSSCMLPSFLIIHVTRTQNEYSFVNQWLQDEFLQLQA